MLYCATINCIVTVCVCIKLCIHLRSMTISFTEVSSCPVSFTKDIYIWELNVFRFKELNIESR